MSLKICLIGKYFPIQGGVSKDNQWLAYMLARAGFQVHVVTNAEEVEPHYRCINWSTYPLLHPDCTGSITIHTTDKRERCHYIPYANNFVTKLASLATEVIRTYECDLIYSYYLEPYAVAASLASRWTGVPYGIRHAGSDIGALFQSKELQTAYREVILAADYIVATPSTYRGFLSLGVAQDKLYFPAGFCLPPGVFSPHATPLDVNMLLTWIHEHLSDNFYYDVFRHFAQKSFHPKIPTIGIYGKVGRVKGSFDLVDVLGQLRREGIEFQLLALAQGGTDLLAEFVAAIERQGLTQVTWLLPFLPHWSVPQFIKTCTAICCLERDFPIPIHTPFIPQEVFLCGTCLVLSHEIAEKQPYRERCKHGTNVFLVDPHDHKALAEILHTIIRDPLTCQSVGQQGFHDMGIRQEQLVATEQRWQQLFPRIYNDIQHRRQAMSLAEMQSYLARLYTDESLRKLFMLAPEVSFEAYALTEPEKQALRAIDQRLLEHFAASLKMKQMERLRSMYRATFALPESLIQRLFNRFYHLYPAHPHEELFTRIREFGIFMEQALAVDEQAPCYSSEVAKYERLFYLYTYQPEPEDTFTAINARGTEVATPLGLEVIPIILPGVYWETFTYPIVSLIDALSTGQSLPEQSIVSGRYDLIFQREAHSLTLNVFATNTETTLLLDLCQEGRHTCAALIEAIEQQLEETGLTEDVLSTLSMLQEKKILGVRHEPG